MRQDRESERLFKKKKRQWEARDFAAAHAVSEAAKTRGESLKSCCCPRCDAATMWERRDPSCRPTRHPHGHTQHATPISPWRRCWLWSASAFTLKYFGCCCYHIVSFWNRVTGLELVLSSSCYHWLSLVVCFMFSDMKSSLSTDLRSKPGVLSHVA